MSPLSAAVYPFRRHSIYEVIDRPRRLQRECDAIDKVDKSRLPFRRTGDMNDKFDWITAVLVFVLMATLLAFFTGLFPYPYGWLVFTALLVYRLFTLPKKEG